MADARATVTDATGTGAGSDAVTVSVALPVTCRFRAMMLALPAARAVTRPASETLAIVESLELHWTGRTMVAPRRSFIVVLACVVSPTLIELDASRTTIDATILFASTDKSSGLSPFGAVDDSEHDEAAISARAIAAEPVRMRFTNTPMNRATNFSWVVESSTVHHDAYDARNTKRCYTTGNAVGTARIYRRQAKRSNRHCR